MFARDAKICIKKKVNFKPYFKHKSMILLTHFSHKNDFFSV